MTSPFLTPAPLRDLNWHRQHAAGLAPAQLRRAARKRQQRGDVRAARVYLEALHHAAPDLDTALDLAALHRQCHEHARGIALLSQACSLWPDRVDILHAMAELAMLAKEYALAAGLWARLVRLQGAAGVYPVLRAIACHRQTGDDPAVTDLMDRCAASLRLGFPPPALELLRAGVGVPRPAPGLYMVTGNNGTGKTTLGHFLQAMGVQIIDADTEIAAFSMGEHWSVLRHDLTRGRPEAEARTAWVWPVARFEAACTAAGASHRAVFVIGGFGQTVAPFAGRARHVFHLTAPTEVIARRLARRGSPAHRPGTAGHAAALRRNARVARPDYPAKVLRADRSVWEICAEILDVLRGSGPCAGNVSRFAFDSVHAPRILP